MPSRSRVLALFALLALAVAGCGKNEEARQLDKPKVGIKGADRGVVEDLGYPRFATKNTTRIGGADAAANAVGAARAVFAGTSTITRPRAVALVNSEDWRVSLAASVLMSSPIRAPMLLSEGRDLEAGNAAAIKALAPRGARPAGDAQIIRVGEVPRPAELRTTDIAEADAFGIARAIDAFQAAARGTTSDRVLVVSADQPAYAMPAAAWAAKAGDPILFTNRDKLPAETRAAIGSHQQPKIYVLGPSEVIGPKVTKELRKLGTVTRVGGETPEKNSIAFARFLDGAFGWGVVDPGHGVVFANARRPTDAGAVSPLSATGTYGPLIVLGDGARLSRAVEDFLLSIQPGYDKDPVRAVYNHGWIVGDEQAISLDVQARIDALMEIVPVQEQRNASAAK